MCQALGWCLGEGCEIDHNKGSKSWPEESRRDTEKEDREAGLWRGREVAILKGMSGKAPLQRCHLSRELGMREWKDSHRKDTLEQRAQPTPRPRGGGMPGMFGEQQGSQCDGSKRVRGRDSGRTCGQSS